MSTPEPKEQQREDLRQRIVEAARDIVSEQGLDALSMRALALRIDHSPGTIYLYFKDKEELLRSVMSEGFRRLGASIRAELDRQGDEASPLQQYAATGRGYAKFALENTGYFRSMFKMPRVAQLEGCPEHPGGVDEVDEVARVDIGELLARASAQGQVRVDDPRSASAMGWGMIHGLTSLYLSGHLSDLVGSHDEFMELIESAMDALHEGWRPR
jgi:AcrR family transcriptional regulator